LNRLTPRWIIELRRDGLSLRAIAAEIGGAVSVEFRLRLNDLVGRETAAEDRRQR
jgi:hypothetical protein